MNQNKMKYPAKSNTGNFWPWSVPVFFALALTLNGCSGFVMRGFDLELPFDRISLQGAGGIATDIRQTLMDRQTIKIMSKPTEAQVVLHVAEEKFEKTVIAFSSAGRPREIELRLKAEFRVTDGYAVELYPITQLSQSRTLTVPENEILVNTASEQLLREDMQRDIANQIIRRLRAVKIPS